MVSFSALRNPSLIVEAVLIAGMIATTFIAPIIGAVSVWSGIPALLYLRAVFWIAGLLLLPGLYVVRLIPPLSGQSLPVRIVLGTLLSFAILGTLTMALDLAGALAALPWAGVALTAVLGALSWYRNRGSPPMSLDLKAMLKGMHKGYIILIAAAAGSVVMAILFQNYWHYLYPQDVWVSLTSGVKLITGRSVVEAFQGTSYPVAFGFIIAGLSICTGLPIVNAHALLIPFTAIDVLVLFSLARVVFGRGVYTSAIASLVFGFCGGIGWAILFSIASTTLSNWNNIFMYISNVTRDMYFGPFFFYSFFLYYKSLALAMAIASIVVFSISGRITEIRSKALVALMGSLLIVWAFLIHMLPALLAPMTLVIALLVKERRQHLISFLILAVSAIALLLMFDFLLGGIYIILIFVKGGLVIPSSRLMIYGIGLAAVVAVLAAVYYLFRRGTIKLSLANPLGRYGKPAVVLVLLAVFLAGGLFFRLGEYTTSSSAVFTWPLYVTRYGLIGVLALIGLYSSRWKAEWLRICVAWAIVAIAMGSVWWGERLNSFLFPMVAILTGAAIVNITSRATSSKAKKGAPKTKAARRDPRMVLATATLLGMLALSFASPMVGAYNFMVAPTMVTDDMVVVYGWMAKNTPPDSESMCYPYPFTLGYGIMTLADRSLDFGTSTGSYSVVKVPELVANLSAKGVQYIVVDPTNPYNSDVSSVVWTLQSYSDVLFRSGNITVSAIPHMALPSNASSTVVHDWGQTEELRFLAISIPSLWPTGYRIVNDSSLAVNASVVVSPYSAYINSTMLSFRQDATVVLLTLILSTPSWGTGWHTPFPGTLAGTYEGRQVFIVQSNTPQLIGNLTAYSQQLYGEITG